MFQRTSWDLVLFLPPTGVLFRLDATSFAARLLKNSIQPSVKCLAILSFLLFFSFRSEKYKDFEKKKKLKLHPDDPDYTFYEKRIICTWK